MDQAQALILRDQLADALAVVESTTGLQLTVGKLIYTEHGCEVGISFSEKRDDGILMTPEAVDWNYHGHKHGLCRKWLGRTVDYYGQTYKLTGLKTRAKRYKVCAEHVQSGATIGFTPTFVIEQLTGVELSDVPMGLAGQSSTITSGEAG